MQEQVFDNYAISYDDHFTNSLIGKAQRKQVYRHAINNAYFFQKNVLEVNCGTGEDAVWLAKEGANVLATDISEEMLKVAKNKIKGKNIQFHQLASQDIGTLTPETFQSIFSNFGGLNCLSLTQLEKFAEGCANIQKWEDQLILVIMGTKCIWEKLYFNFKGESEKAKRRSSNNGIDTLIGKNHFKTYYYSPEQIKKLFKAEYDHINTKPVGLFVPPSYLEPYFVKRKFLLGVLQFLDRLFSFSFLSNYADHYIIIFEKK